MPVVPTKLTAETTDRIVTAIRAGASLEAAAGYAGVGRQTFFDWLRKGRQTDPAPVYADLVAAVDEALAQFEVHAVGRIAKAGETEWQADAWRLERRFPDRYGRRTRVDGNVTVQAAPFIDTSKLTLDEQRTLLELLEKASPAQEQLAEGQKPALELLPGGIVETP